MAKFRVPRHSVDINPRLQNDLKSSMICSNQARGRRCPPDIRMGIAWEVGFMRARLVLFAPFQDEPMGEGLIRAGTGKDGGGDRERIQRRHDNDEFHLNQIPPLTRPNPRDRTRPLSCRACH